jgi:RNA ligase
MKLDLGAINLDDFIVSNREILDGIPVVLICPKKGKHTWSKDELHLRSLLCDRDGNIICSGFPKFFNYGEDELSDSIISKGISSGKAILLEKMDGSLIIRTVIDGKVSFRTRGSHNLGEFEEPIMRIINDKYPELLNPRVGSVMDMSLLFEYISPDNKVILNYRGTELYFLGGMIIYSNNVVPRFFPAHFFSGITDRLCVKTPLEYSLGDDLEFIRQEVSSWSGKEGIVVAVPRSDGSYNLSKIKTAEYLKLHALRYNLSDSRIEQFCWAGDIVEEDVLRNILFKAGLDWEMTSFISPMFKRYMESRERKELEIAGFLNQLEQEGLVGLEDKKEIAVGLKQFCDEDTKLFPLGIYYLTGNQDRYETSKWAYLIDIPAKTVSNYLEEGRRLMKSIQAN